MLYYSKQETLEGNKEMARYKIMLETEARQELETLIKTHTTEHRMAERAKIVLLSAEGMATTAIADKLDCSVHRVCTWKRRYCENGVAGLREKQRSGRPCSIHPETVEKIITGAVRGNQVMSCRKMAREADVSSATVQRIWAKNDIKPHVSKTFKLSNDVHFEEKFWDIIGLYLDPPERALVLCCDEKSQIQALERTQPGLPLGMGHIRTQTHDYYRHGTTTLFAALNYLDGKIISRTEERHRHIEWLRFLRQIERETPKKLDIHIILDNYGSHKHPKVMKWMEKHPRFHLHFTPTSASWMNLVERFFRDVHTDVVKNGSFARLSELNKALQDYMQERNSAPRRYVWKADGQKILEKINRAKQGLKAKQ